jgi:hypothetical protein
MKLIIEKKEFAKEFGYYEDQLGSREDKIVDIKFWYQGEEVKVEEIELVFGVPYVVFEKEEEEHNEDYEMLAGENKCFAEFLKKQGYSDEQINDIAYGSKV